MIMFNDLMKCMAYGSNLTVVDCDTDEELININDFFAPNNTNYIEASVQCIGQIGDRLYIWVKKEGE